MYSSDYSELTAIAQAFASGRSPSPSKQSGQWKGAHWERAAAAMRARVARIGKRERPAEPAAALPVRNLEEVTLELQRLHLPDVIPGEGPCADGQISVKVTRYADGLRVVAYQRRSATASAGGSVSRAELSSATSEGESEKQRAQSSLARSRALVVHRARCLGPVGLWTFTKRGKFSSVDEVWSAWRQFTQMARRRYGKGFRFVAVPELHADGETWHLHVLVDRLYMVESFRVLWGRALGGTGLERGSETLGNVNAKSLRGGRWSSWRAARYVAKYVGKGFTRGSAHRRLFGASLGLDAEVLRRRISWDAGIIAGAALVRDWVREAFSLEWFPYRFVLEPLWQCAIAEVQLKVK